MKIFIMKSRHRCDDIYNKVHFPAQHGLDFILMAETMEDAIKRLFKTITNDSHDLHPHIDAGYEGDEAYNATYTVGSTTYFLFVRTIHDPQTVNLL